MTATFVIILFALACAVMALICLPGVILILEWVDAKYPGLSVNIMFWTAIGIVGTLFYLMVSQV